MQTYARGELFSEVDHTADEPLEGSPWEGRVLDSEAREGLPSASKRGVTEPPACLRGLWLLCIVTDGGRRHQGGQ